MKEVRQMKQMIGGSCVCRGDGNSCNIFLSKRKTMCISCMFQSNVIQITLKYHLQNAAAFAFIPFQAYKYLNLSFVYGVDGLYSTIAFLKFLRL
jgi:hypothetical protein